MPGLSTENVEQSEKKMENQLTQAGHMTVEPMVVCGVNRKVNIGNYENIDVYVGVSLPISSIGESDDIREAVKEAARVGIEMASEETFSRYEAIKGSL